MRNWGGQQQPAQVGPSWAPTGLRLMQVTSQILTVSHWSWLCPCQFPSDHTSELIKWHGFLLPLEPGVSPSSARLPLPRSLPLQRQLRSSAPQTYPKQTSVPEIMAWSRKISLGASSDSELLDQTPVESREYPTIPWLHQPHYLESNKQLQVLNYSHKSTNSKL